MQNKDFANKNAKKRKFRTIVNFLSGNYGKNPKRKPVHRKLLIKASEMEKLNEEFIENSDIK